MLRPSICYGCRCQVPTTGAYLNENANFSSFPLAFLTLIRISTGENWNGLMHECAAYYKGTATAFFCSFVILISYVMLNLFIATMLENFQVTTVKADLHIEPY